MNKQDRELLLRDLCARTPYKPKINVDDIGLFIPTLKYIDGITCHFYECSWTKFIDEIKPYLRPMSSMTEEERIFYNNAELDGEFGYNPYFKIPAIDTIDWLNAHHFDYRDLISKGLALEAPKDIYK